ncbi:response regulator transcription factor [Hymenobacter sp. BT683]|uniref:Response regulator transcription factor n=2 Tax=Hymenobacter jeongseonensis TaxID=2791027 RepID=A0ABS0IDS8_9BACT|nr:response regulator transcription factor [Hymenobacter jeongseonensis]
MSNMNKVLLIVDDEPSICLILEHYFGLDYKVVVKANGLQAMEWLEQGNTPDAIVADYDMPVMDGPDFIKQIRASSRHRDVGLIILSGKDSTSNKITCLKLGADDYLVKPFNPEELSLRIQNLLHRIRV